MASVTLPGANPTGVVTVQSGSGDHIFVAQIIANTILLNSVGGSLNAAQTDTVGSGATTAPPPTGGSDKSILYLYGSGGGTLTIPGGYNYVVDLMTGPETISASNVQMISYDSAGSTYQITGNSSLAAQDPNDVVTISGVFNEATGDGNNTVDAIGAGTVGGGTGTNDYSLTPSVGGTGILLQSNGTGDSVTVTDPSGGVATVNSTGNDLTLGSLGLVTIEAALSGNDATVTGGIADTDLTTSGTDNVVLGGSSGTVTYLANGFGDTVAGFGAATFNVSLAGSGGSKGTGDLLIGGTGALDAVLSNVWETVGGGSGSAAVTIQDLGLASHELVLGNSGSLSVNDAGESDTIAAFSATSPTATLGGSDNLLIGGSNNIAVTVTGTTDTVAAGSGATSVTATSGAIVFGSSGGLDITGGADASSVLGASGATNAVTVGAGGILFFTGGNDTTSIVGGTGQTTLVGAGGSNMFFHGSGGGLNFAAGAGNETLNASGSTTNDFYGSGSDSTGGDTITGGSGDDTFTAGAGADSFVGGAGDNTFVFFASQTSLNSAGAHDYLSNWTSSDGLFLIGYSSTDSAASLMANSTVSGGNLTIKLSDNTEITFNNVSDTATFNGKIYYT